MVMQRIRPGVGELPRREAYLGSLETYTPLQYTEYRRTSCIAHYSAVVCGVRIGRRHSIQQLHVIIYAAFRLIYRLQAYREEL